MKQAGEWRFHPEDGTWKYHGPPDESPVFAEPTPLQKLAVRALTFSLVIVIPLGAIFLVNRHQTANRVAANKAAIVRESQIRRQAIASTNRLAQHFANVQAWADFDNCVADEYQDAIIVSILRTIPKDQRTVQVQDAIDGLEPAVGDRVCIPPRGDRPREARP